MLSRTGETGGVSKERRSSAQGRFIVLEGIDGAGTTTQASRMASWLEARGVQTLVTREPSDGPVGMVIRNALRGRIRLPSCAGSGELPKETIALLFAADRIDHLQAEIIPALAQGVWVISDRYVQSSVAYQGTLIELDWVAEINRYAVEPDLTLFLEVDVDEALRRIGSTRVQTDIFEEKGLLTRIADGYRAFYASHPDAAVVIDSGQPIDVVSESLFTGLNDAFPELTQDLP